MYSRNIKSLLTLKSNILSYYMLGNCIHLKLNKEHELVLCMLCSLNRPMSLCQLPKHIIWGLLIFLMLVHKLIQNLHLFWGLFSRYIWVILVEFLNKFYRTCLFFVFYRWKDYVDEYWSQQLWKLFSIFALEI